MTAPKRRHVRAYEHIRREREHERAHRDDECAAGDVCGDGSKKDKREEEGWERNSDAYHRNEEEVDQVPGQSEVAGQFSAAQHGAGGAGGVQGALFQHNLEVETSIGLLATADP